MAGHAVTLVQDNKMCFLWYVFVSFMQCLSVTHVHCVTFCTSLFSHIKNCYWCFANYENNQQDVLYRLIYYSKSAVHVSDNVFAHHQEHVTVFTVSGSVHPSCCRCTRLATHIVQFQLIRDTSRQQLGWMLPDTVNTVMCSWWWAKTSPETCRADLE